MAVKEMASSPTMTLSLRIPKELNEWLDRYTHLSYPERITKQSLVIEALSLIYLKRGEAKEKLINSLNSAILE